MFDFLKNEPVAIQAVVQSALAVVAGFDLVPMTQSNMGLLLALSAAILGVVARQQVTPTRNIPTA